MAASLLSPSMTGPAFDALPYEEGRKWELLDGQLQPRPSPTPQHQSVVQQVLFLLIHYFKERAGAGQVFFDLEFALGADSRVRPDVSIIVGQKSRDLDLKKSPVAGFPDIAVEVISSGERSWNSQKKVQLYLTAGTHEAWQVYPDSQLIVIQRGEESKTFTVARNLQSPLLPDFLLPIKDIF